MNVCLCVISPLNILLCLLYRCDGGLYQGNVLDFFTAPCTLVWKPWAYDRRENTRLRMSHSRRVFVSECVFLRLTFIVGGLVCGLWCGTAALRVLAAAGWLTAGLSVLPVHSSLWRGRRGLIYTNWFKQNKQPSKLMIRCLRITAANKWERKLIVFVGNLRAQVPFGLTSFILTKCLVWRCVTGLADLLLFGPAVAVGEPVVLSLVFLVCLNHSVLLKLNQTTLRVPWLHAAKQ